jgi:ankyrin repeat protein
MDRAGRTPLHYAALEGNIGEILRLLADDLDPNTPDSKGFVALHFAAQEYQVAAARALLQGGARVDAVNAYGNTPLWTAVFNSQGRGEIIALLRLAGADPAHVNNAGRTPVELAHTIASSDVAQYFADLTQ